MHSFNDNEVDEAEPKMGVSVNEKLGFEQEWNT